VERNDEDTGFGRFDNGRLGQGLGSSYNEGTVSTKEGEMILNHGVYIPMASSWVGVVASVLDCASFSLSVMVEVEGDREKALRGPRWVSLSFLVNFQDMVI
jgi:hypothetical protein